MSTPLLSIFSLKQAVSQFEITSVIKLTCNQTDGVSAWRRGSFVICRNETRVCSYIPNIIFTNKRLNVILVIKGEFEEI